MLTDMRQGQVGKGVRVKQRPVPAAGDGAVTPVPGRFAHTLPAPGP